MTDAILLNKSFDITEDLIKKNPENENDIINDYVNYIIKVKSNSQINNSFVRSATFKDDDIDNQNGIIKIHNNFQKYNNNNNNNLEPITETFENNFNDYYKKMTGGFKDYFPL
jgi:hypothetical protein